MTTKGYIDRDDVIMVPRSYLRPEFISYASAVQEAPNPYDVNTTAKKLEKITKQRSSNKYQRDYEFHDTLDNFLDRRQESHNIPPPTRIKIKTNKESKHYEDATRESNFEDAYSGTLAALRKVKRETLAGENLSATSSGKTGSSKGYYTPSTPLEKLRMRRILLDAAQEEKTGEYKHPPFTPKKTRTGARYGQDGSGYKYVTLFDTHQREYKM